MNYSNFDRACAFAMDELERYGNHALKGDPGRRTIWGIAEKWHPREVAQMAAVSPEAAKEIAEGVYLRDYWQRAHCEPLPWPACLVVFDYAVQSDPVEAWAQWCVYGDWLGILCKRVRKYAALAETTPQFYNGWINRMEKVYSLARDGQ